MMGISFAFLILLAFGCVDCSVGSERILDVLHQLHHTAKVSSYSIESAFCTKLTKVKSGRLGYLAFESSHIGCGLPIVSVKLDYPIVHVGRDLHSLQAAAPLGAGTRTTAAQVGCRVRMFPSLRAI